MTTETNKPAATVQLGVIRAAAWRNESDNGPWYSVTIERRYKDGEDWKSSDSFGRDDLLTVAKVADLIHTRIHELQAEART